MSVTAEVRRAARPQRTSRVFTPAVTEGAREKGVRRLQHRRPLRDDRERADRRSAPGTAGYQQGMLGKGGETGAGAARRRRQPTGARGQRGGRLNSGKTNECAEGFCGCVVQSGRATVRKRRRYLCKSNHAKTRSPTMHRCVAHAGLAPTQIPRALSLTFLRCRRRQA